MVGTASSIMDNAASRVEDRLRCRFESCLAVKSEKIEKNMKNIFSFKNFHYLCIEQKTKSSLK